MGDEGAEAILKARVYGTGEAMRYVQVTEEKRSKKGAESRCVNEGKVRRQWKIGD